MNYELSDGTVIETSKENWKLGKKFGDQALFIALISTLFPDVIPDLHETMYCLIPEWEFTHFVRVILAVLMVKERFGQGYECMFDDFFGCIGTDVFFVYVQDGKPVPFSEDTGVMLKQLSVSDEAVDKIIQLLSDPQEVEDMFPEPIIAVEDDTPPIYEENINSVAYDITPNACAACHSCTVLSAIDDDTIRQHRINDEFCERHRVDLVPQSPRIFTHLLRHDYNRILYFGRKSFTKVQDVRSRPWSRDPINRVWFLFRMPWERHVP